MRHPYQCVATAVLRGAEQRQVLFAACGPKLFVYDLHNTEHLASWPTNESKGDDEEGSNSSTEIITNSTEPAHRVKRRKKTSARKDGSDQSASTAPITYLVVSGDNQYLLASTGEDKFVHLFSIGGDGSLSHLSQRRMTKRPCALAFTPSNDSILVGDKFGDVYALPLQYRESDKVATENNGKAVARGPFKPSATNLTVHTERNLNALKNQLRQPPTQAKPKEVMEFPHELLLGHVSMLTDMLCARKPSPVTTTTNRDYIITSDRDEHIRVSRAAPQAHVIENYCFGHTQFVSKLCLARADILVSGGGDDNLFVWNWCNGELLGTLPVQPAVKKLRETQHTHTTKDNGLQAAEMVDPLEGTNKGNRDQQPSEDAVDQSPEDRIAVSGIWSRPSQNTKSITVYCSCEAVPAIFEFIFEPDSGLHFRQGGVEVKTHTVPSNPLGMTFLDHVAILSVDSVHDGWSTSSQREGTPYETRLLSLRMDPGASFVPLKVGQDDGEELTEENQFKKAKDLLYSVENLRKHGGEDAE